MRLDVASKVFESLKCRLKKQKSPLMVPEENYSLDEVDTGGLKIRLASSCTVPHLKQVVAVFLAPVSDDFKTNHEQFWPFGVSNFHHSRLG